MGAAAKLATLGVAMVAAHGAGFALWKGSGRAERLGHALTVLGTLVFGASIGLVAQYLPRVRGLVGRVRRVHPRRFAAALLYDSLPPPPLAA